MHKSPIAIAEDLKESLNSDLFEKVEVVNGYVNVFINKKTLTKTVIDDITTNKENFGNSNMGEGKTRPKKVKEEDRNIQTRAGNTAHPAKTYSLTSVLQVRVQS